MPLEQNRLTPTDETFVLAERVVGTPIDNQMLWRFAEPLDHARLLRVHAGLTEGPLSRRLVRAQAAFARDRWVAASDRARPLTVSDPITSEQILTWADDVLREPFDLEAGTVWRFAAAPLVEGGHVVSLTASHAVSDGGGAYVAIAAAVSGAKIGQLPDDSPTAAQASRREDIVDGARQFVRGCTGFVSTLREVRRRRKDHSAPPAPPAAPAPKPIAPQQVSATPQAGAIAIVSFEQSELEAAAAQRGGSVNSLLIAFSVGLLAASGRVDKNTMIPVSAPISVRTPGDRRAVATIGSTMAVEVRTDSYPDLGPIRSTMREAITAATTPERAERNLVRLITPTLRLLPRRLLKAIADRQQASVLTCSNVGNVPHEVASLGGPSAGRTSIRMMLRGASVDKLRASGGGITSWLAVSGGSAQLSILSLDPDRLPTPAALQQTIRDVAAKWSLEPTFW